MRTNTAQRVAERIQKLEKRYRGAIQVLRTPDGPSGAEALTERLARFGIARRPEESLAETTARALGISCSELKSELQRIAALASR